MNRLLAEAYEELEQDIAAALQEHRGNSSVISTALKRTVALIPTGRFR